MDQDWRISYCSGYIVPPCKHLEYIAASEQIRGSRVTLEDKVHTYFHPKFVDSPNSCTVHTVFTSKSATTHEERQNDIRDLVRNLAFGSTIEQNEASKGLAIRLGLATDGRSHRKSPVGLLIALAGVLNDKVRVVLFKFPADDSLQATFVEEGLSISVVEGAFSRGNDYFKAAVFEGNRANNAFWFGRVEDKQTTQRASGVSDFWVIGFLQSLPRLTDAEGSRVLARGVRNVTKKVKEPDLQHRMIASATTIRSQHDRQITLREFAENYLPVETRELFLSELGSPLLADVPFRIDSETLDDHFGVKTIYLDSQLSVTGPLDVFQNPEFFTQVSDNDDITLITLRGRIAGERLSTARGIQRS